MSQKGSLIKRKIPLQQAGNSKILLIPKENQTKANKTLIQNRLFAEIQHTFNEKKREPQKQSMREKQDEDQMKIQALQYQVDKLILQVTQIDSEINEDEVTTRDELVTSMLELTDLQIDFLRNISINKNHAVNQVYSIPSYSNFEVEYESKLKTFENNLKKKIYQDIKVLQNHKNEILEMEKEHQLLMQQSEQLSKENNDLKIDQQKMQNRNQFLQLEQNKKLFQTNILQEQLNVYRNYSQVICVFTNKSKIYDKNYEPYFTINQKQIEMISKSKQILKNSYSDGKIVISQAHQFKFDYIIRRQGFDEFILHEEVFKYTRVFLTQLFYQQMNLVYQQLPFNSLDYETIFNNVSYNNNQTQRLISLLNQKCNDKVKDCMIIVISRKFSNFTHKYLERIINHFLSFKNHIAKVYDFIAQWMIINVKSDTLKNVLSFKLDDYQQRIPEIQFDVVENEISHFQLTFQFNNQISRSINFLCINPKAIPNEEQFCRQLKSAFKKEKTPKESLGQKLENLIKLSDKRLIITEVPEMIKMTNNFYKKIKEIQNVFYFTSKIAQKKT